MFIIGLCAYVSVIMVIVFTVYRRVMSAGSSYDSLVLGNRSMSYWLTALSAHASDMSDWLFMAFPAAIFAGGMLQSWIGIGLVIGMFCVWQWIAPRLRIATEKTNSVTLSTYFEKRFQDASGNIRLLSAGISLFFFAVYIAAGFKGFGFLMESVLGISYSYGILIAGLSVILYTILGGFVALAWIDAFQALFLLTVILIVPLVALVHIGGFSAVSQVAHAQRIPLSIIPTNIHDAFVALFTLIPWAFGYCGTPHILTKFMGISDVALMHKSKYVGMTWQVIVLSAAALAGLVGIAYFPEGLVNKELVFVEMVKMIFSPLVAGFMLSAIAGATLSVVAAQILVLITTITEDLYKRIRVHATSQELVVVYRIGILIITGLAMYIGLDKSSTIQNLVQYAWVGLGCSFGPLVIMSLFHMNINANGAYAAMIVGGALGALWQRWIGLWLAHYIGLVIPATIPGVILSFMSAYFVTYVTKRDV